MSNQPIILVRPLETIAEFHAAEEVQRQVWSGTDLEVVPLHMLTTVAHNGGLVLGAFHADRLVGFLLGFLGTDEGQMNRPALARLKHCSHMMGVLPEYQGQHVGYQLKLAQRDYVSVQGVRLITWTYDPLESRNQVDWWITSPRVKERMFGQRAPLVLESFTSAGAEILNPTQEGVDGLTRPAETWRTADNTLALIEIPTNFQLIKQRNMGLARAWRSQTRSMFREAFGTGYWVTDFFHEPVDGRDRAFYALSRGEIRVEVSEN